MDESKHRLWDTFIKALGFIATAASIFIGLSQFSSQQASAADLEFKRNFWQKQTELYAEVCRNAGMMAATINDPKVFARQKENFLSLYYGELVLVEDGTVEKAMRELRSYLEIVDPADPNMVNTFKRKVIELSEACKKSSGTFKRFNLQ